MDELILTISVTVFGALGGYIPVWLWHADPLGGWSILGGLIGGFAGIWAWWWLKQRVDW